MPTETWTRLPEPRRAAVLAAAEAEFAAHGFSRGSLNVIAREAGVAKGRLFQYFDDKADLFVHLSGLVVDRVAAELEEGGGLEVDWEAGMFVALASDLGRWTDYFRTHPVERALSAAVTLEPDPDARRAVRAVVDERLIDGWRPLLHEARDRGCLRPDADLDAFLSLLLLVLSHLALAPSHPELDPVLGLGGIDPAEGIARYVAVFEAAFGPV